MVGAAYRLALLLSLVPAVEAERVQWTSELSHEFQLTLDADEGEISSVAGFLASEEWPESLRKQQITPEGWQSICTQHLAIKEECASRHDGFMSCAVPPKLASDFPNETVVEATRRVGIHNCKLRSNAPLCSYPPEALLPKGQHDDLSTEARNTAVVNVDHSVMTHLVGRESVWIVEYFADWCPHCKKLAPNFFAIGAALRRAGSATMLGAVNCEVHADLCQEAGVKGYPALNVFYSGSNATVKEWLKHFQQTHLTENHVKMLLPFLHQASGGRFGLSFEAVVKAYMIQGAASGDCQQQRDIAVGGGWPEAEARTAPNSRLSDARFMLLYTLRHWVSPTPQMVKPRAFTHNDLVPLALWLKLVARNFPDPDLATKFGRLAATVDEAAKRLQAICVENWARELDNLGFPTADEIAGSLPLSSTCETETCRVWALIHILSLARLVHWPGAASDQEALAGIHSFLEHHFRCDVCRNHYLEQAKKGAYGRDSIKNGQVTRHALSPEVDTVTLAVYLWRFHNAVSVRIAAEKDCVDPLVDRRWPQSSCKQCWKHSAEQWPVLDEAAEIYAHVSSQQSLSKLIPDEEVVTRFLVQEYWPTNGTVA